MPDHVRQVQEVRQSVYPTLGMSQLFGMSERASNIGINQMNKVTYLSIKFDWDLCAYRHAWQANQWHKEVVNQSFYKLI